MIAKLATVMLKLCQIIEEKRTRQNFEFWHGNCEEKAYESINNSKFNKELHLLNLEGDALRNSHTNSGPKDAVSTNLPLGTVLYHSSKKT